MFFKVIPIDKEKQTISWVRSKNDQILKLISSLGIRKVTDKLFIQKDIRGFEKEGFYIIKPNEIKLWHKAIAYLDLDEFVDAILVTGKKEALHVQ
jgi:hypothetical protein